MYGKILTAILVVVLTFSFTACAGDSSAETGTDASTQGNSTLPDKAPTTSPETDVPFSETIIVDNQEILFKITAIKTDPIWGYTLKAQIKNRTGKDLMFALQDVSVNGYMCEPHFAATVTAGMNANKDISFSKDSLADNGILDVTNITFTLRVYDSNDWTAKDTFKEAFTIYPKGKEADKEYPREGQETDIILFDNEDCTMIITGFDPESIWGYSANVYLVNKTDDTLTFSVGEASINDYMCNPYFVKTVAPGKQCNTAISWSKNSLEENGITKVETLHLPIRVYDANDWTEDALIDNTFTVKP